MNLKENHKISGQLLVKVHIFLIRDFSPPWTSLNISKEVTDWLK